MPIFTQRTFSKYHMGDNTIYSHIDAVHAVSPGADKRTDEIVKGVVEQINCSGIISTISRKDADLNRPRSKDNEKAVDEYRQTIREILEHLGIVNEEGKLTKPYLHLAIHGIQDRDDKKRIEIGTRCGRTCDLTIRNWLRETLSQKIYCNVVVDVKYIGDISLTAHRIGDSSGYSGYGNLYNAIQVEISRTLREKSRQELIKAFSDIILEFNSKFSNS